MQRIGKKIVTNEANQAIAVQIDYTDWLKIEQALQLPEKEEATDLSRHVEVICLTEEPLAYQTSVRGEWS